MCGPLLFTFSMFQKERGRHGWRLLPVLLVYHAGRLAAYAGIGLALGLLGSAARLAGQGPALQGGISLGVGLLMGLMGAGLMGWVPGQRGLESGFPHGLLVRWMSRITAHPGRVTPLIWGFCNGLLPCGPVYAAAAGAVAAARPVMGAVAMLAFGLGTVPVVLAIGLGAGKLAPRLQSRLFKLAAALVLLIGLQLILRGAAALGWIPHARWGEFVLW
jgi:sulfite exporter TauE/SafE